MRNIGGHAFAVPDMQRTALGLWLASYRSENTRRAYRRLIEAFARFTGKCVFQGGFDALKQRRRLVARIGRVR